MAAPPNTFTHIPRLRSTLWLGSLQLLSWFFFHPTAWRNHIQRADSSLSPGFSLAELTWRQWQNRQIIRPLFMGYLYWPLWITLTCSLVLWLAGQWSAGLVWGVALGLGMGLIFGFSLGAAIGMNVTLVASLFFALVLGSTHVLLVDLLFSPLLGIGFGLAAGLISYTVTNIGSYELSPSVTSGGGGLAGGGLIAGLTLLLIAGTIILVITGWQSGLLNNVAFSILLSVPPALAIAVGIRIRTRLWSGGLLFSLGFGLVVATIFNLIFPQQTYNHHLFGLTLLAIASLIAIVVFAMLFILPYGLAERIAGPWVAAGIGSLGSLTVFPAISLVFPLYQWQPNAGFYLLTTFLGMTLAWWRPFLTYPLAQVWNLLLYRLDLEQTEPGTRRQLLLHRHTAFWDEQQRLPLSGLADYVIWTLDNDPKAGEAAMRYLLTGHQRWAAQAVQIELDARRLESYAEPMAIAGAFRELAGEGLEGPATALLRSFGHISQDVAAAVNQSSVYHQRLALNAVADRLNALLRELTRSNEPYAARFRRAAEKWQQVVTTYVDRLTKAVEARQEIDNPYIIGIPLTAHQEIFVGRIHISRQIENLILDQRQPPLLLYGQRRMGKTSLLNNLGRLLPRSICPLFVDLQGPVSFASDHAGLFYNLARSMRESAQRTREVSLPPLSRETLQHDPFTGFDEWLDAVEQSLAPQPNASILLLMDEFEALDHALAEGRFSETAVLGTFRHIIQHRTRFKILLAGSHTLDEFQRWSSYLINAQVVPISYLTEDEAYQLIERPVANFSLRYQPAASQHVFYLTNGHPFLLQLLCAEVVSLKNQQSPDRRYLVTPEDVETAVPEALMRGSLFFADIERNQITRPARQLLLRLARQGEAAGATAEVIAAQFAPDVWPDALSLLQQRQLVRQENGRFCFQVELIRRWFGKMAQEEGVGRL
jgi:hypothetical protein